MKKLPVELRQLEYFQMAARLRNLTKAAERLNVSQPNVTVAIKKLESELGIQLFDRSQKQLSLTPEGNVFLARVDTALRTVQDAIIEINDYKKLQRGAIRIGIPPMIGSNLFPRIFYNFRRRYPHLSIYLHEEGSAAIRERIESDDLDFGIVITTDPSSTLKVAPMSRCQVVAGVPKDHILAAKKSITLQDLASSDLIMMREGSFIRSQIMSRFHQEGLRPNVILESNQTETIKALVGNGVGITVLLDFIFHIAKQFFHIVRNSSAFSDISFKTRIVDHAEMPAKRFKLGISNSFSKHCVYQVISFWYLYYLKSCSWIKKCGAKNSVFYKIRRNRSIGADHITEASQ